jgi:hypothetical protein
VYGILDFYGKNFLNIALWSLTTALLTKASQEKLVFSSLDVQAID